VFKFLVLPILGATLRAFHGIIFGDTGNNLLNETRELRILIKFRMFDL